VDQATWDNLLFQLDEQIEMTTLAVDSREPFESPTEREAFKEALEGLMWNFLTNGEVPQQGLFRSPTLLETPSQVDARIKALSTFEMGGPATQATQARRKRVRTKTKKAKPFRPSSNPVQRRNSPAGRRQAEDTVSGASNISGRAKAEQFGGTLGGAAGGAAAGAGVGALIGGPAGAAVGLLGGAVAGMAGGAVLGTKTGVSELQQKTEARKQARARRERTAVRRQR
jgi:hypothetical protein